MTQNFQNHTRLVTGFHKVLGLLAIIGIIGATINVFQSCGSATFYSATLILLLFLIVTIVGLYARSFALKAQDRAIRAEENFRHYILTGKILPSELKMNQIVALRFAADDEFIGLISIAISQNLKNKEIKSRIKNWKADFNRV